MATFVSQSTRSVCVARRIHSGVLPPGAEIPLDS